MSNSPRSFVLHSIERLPRAIRGKVHILLDRMVEVGTPRGYAGVAFFPRRGMRTLTVWVPLEALAQEIEGLKEAVRASGGKPLGCFLAACHLVFEEHMNRGRDPSEDVLCAAALAALCRVDDAHPNNLEKLAAIGIIPVVVVLRRSKTTALVVTGLAGDGKEEEEEVH